MRVAALCIFLVAGCMPAPQPNTDSPVGRIAPGGESYIQPLPVQQQRAYPETVTGRFVSLADFEDSGLLAGGGQLRHFAVNPIDTGRLRRVLNVTRTGIGAVDVLLPAKGSLVFRTPYIHDFRPYTLLSLAVWAEAVRDDLVITLSNTTATWRGPQRLVRPGWNTVMIDLARLQRSGTFDLADVRTIEIRFACAEDPISFGLDDIMLIDNRRQIADTPTGVQLHKTGLDYVLTLPGWDIPIYIAQSDDGLWRLGPYQPAVNLAATTNPDPSPAQRPDDPPAQGVAREDLSAMGRRTVGNVELLEANPIRLRIRNTWYFPPQPGEWADMDVRQIRWEYTFYA
ncbi:MAG: hypothetical protein HQ546_11225, partial [Planctomycetes bacterium]|nr:hypothetical protein [Planctomycetota bacterium]